MFYSFRQQRPAPLPFRIRLSDGFTRYKHQPPTAEEILDAGYVAFTEPAYNAATEQLLWVDGAYVIEALPPWYDQQFYLGPDLPKDHDQLVELWTTQTRTTAGTLLTPTDWMVIREADNGTLIDPDIKALREDIRLAAGTKITAITDTTTTDELAAYITGPDYPIWPSDAVEPVLVEPTPFVAPTFVGDWTASANGI